MDEMDLQLQEEMKYRRRKIRILNKKKETVFFVLSATILLVLHIIDLFVETRNVNYVFGILHNLAEICLGAGILYFCIKTCKGKEQLYKKDYLTGGYNREGFLETVKKRFHLEKETGIIVYLDVENFREINKKLGEEKANEILCCIHAILEKTVGNSGVVCRNSTDQFILYCQTSQEEVKHLLAEQVSLIQAAVLDTAINFYIGAYCLENAEELLNGIHHAVYMSRKKCEMSVSFIMRK